MNIYIYDMSSGHMPQMPPLYTTCITYSIWFSLVTCEITKIDSALALLRVHRPNAVPYVGMPWADFYSLSGSYY